MKSKGVGKDIGGESDVARATVNNASILKTIGGESDCSREAV